MDDKTSSILRPSMAFEIAFEKVFSSTSQSQSPSHMRPKSCSSTYSKAHLSGVDQRVNMERNNQFTHQAAMLSPPEQVRKDSFSRKSARTSMELQMKQLANSGRGLPPPSPPISPETRTINTADVSATIVIRDPILFPHRGSDASPSPLFADHDTLRVVDDHVAARESRDFRAVSPPRHSEYQLALEFKSQVLQAFNANRRLWAQRELAQLREDNSFRKYTAIAPAGSGQRIRPNPNLSKSARPSQFKVVKSRVPPTVRHNGVGGGTLTDGVKKVAREDKDFGQLPDYCPPLSSLPNKSNSLKVDWRGAPIDLKGDPYAHLLHPDELSLASNLRLDCATYLTSKRRIFIKRIEAFKIGKEFRKTDAQQACKIDVNKASKLWQAFDKVHWLDPAYIRKYV